MPPPDANTTPPARPSAPQNPYLFVVGCPRSGTTLLQRMLDSHPALAVANDTHFIPRALKGRPAPAGPLPLTDLLVERVRTYRRFHRLGLTDADVDAAAATGGTYAGFVQRLYTTFAHRQGKPLGGEKTPDYARHITLLHHLFPQARFVHIVRDGRDVALSAMGWAHANKGPGRWGLWQTSPVATCALWWRWQVEAGRRQGQGVRPGCYREVAYEALVDQPEAHLRTLAGFLGLPYAPEMAAFYEGKTRHNPALSAKSAWLPPTRGLRDWRSQMDEADVALFEALAGDLLTVLGYPRQFPRIPSSIDAAAEPYRRWWAAGQRRRRPALPSHPSAVS